MKFLFVITTSILLLACADGRVDVIDRDGNIIGYCSADFKFHIHGAQHSVNYMLFICAEEHINNGFSISDESILTKDYSFPNPPEGTAWNQRLAKEQFSNDTLSEEKYGYILAHIEFEYWEKLKKAKDELSRSVITEEQYESIVTKARDEFKGT